MTAIEDALDIPDKIARLKMVVDLVNRSSIRLQAAVDCMVVVSY